MRCLREDVTPRSIKLSSNVKGHKADKILRSAERKLLNERIRQTNFTIGVLKEKVTDYEEHLFTSLPGEAFDRIQEFTTRAQLAQHESMKKCHVDKFSRLKLKSRADLDLNWRARTETEEDNNSERWVKNLSDRPLSDSEVSVLRKGLNYAVTPDKKPITEIVTATESGIKQAQLPPSEAEELRHKIRSVIVNIKLPTPTVTTLGGKQCNSGVKKGQRYSNPSSRQGEMCSGA